MLRTPMKQHDPRERPLSPPPTRRAEEAREPAAPTSNRTRLRHAGTPALRALTGPASPGNHALAKLSRTNHAIQADSLRVGASDTRWEHEAHAVADSAARGGPLPAISAVHGADEGHTRGPSFARDLTRARDGGQPLGEATRAALEPRFGHDLSPVRIHRGPEAARLNQRLHARAFTHGADIFVGDRQPDLESPAGQRLLHHELTHVIQQQGAAAPAIQREGEDGPAPAQIKGPEEFLSALQGCLTSMRGGTGYSDVVRALERLQSRCERFDDDDPCMLLLGELERTFRALYAAKPVPLQEALSQTEIDFVAATARRDAKREETRALKKEEKTLAEQVEGTGALRKRDTKAKLARVKDQVSTAAAEFNQLETGLWNEFKQYGSYMVQLLERTAARRVDQHPRVLEMYDTLAKKYGGKTPESMRYMIARRVCEHLGADILRYYRSISGVRYE